MNYIFSFLVSVMANIISCYVRRWLDRNNDDS